MPAEHRGLTATTTRPGRAPVPHASRPSTSAGALLALQRSAGNHAVAVLLRDGTAQVQRLAIRSQDLDVAMSSKGTGVLGIRSSSFSVVRYALEDYERARARRRPDLARLTKLLERLDHKVTRWLNEHRGAAGQRADDRHRLLQRLSDAIAAERASLSRGAAEEVYLESLAGGPGAAHPFAAASGGARTAGSQARDRFAAAGAHAEQQQSRFPTLDVWAHKVEGYRARQALMQDRGMSPAEIAAISAYTEGDYNYINPVTGNAASWLDARRKANAAQPWAKLPDQVLREEGGVHAAMATSGLGKMERYARPTYRGATTTSKDFAADVGTGKNVTMPALTSTAKDPAVAEDFIKSGISRAKPIGLMWIYVNSGGRDVQQLSAIRKEAEVLLLPGTPFRISSVMEVGAGGPGPVGPLVTAAYARLLAALRAGAFPGIDKLYVVVAHGKLPPPPPPLPGVLPRPTGGMPPLPPVPGG